MHRGCFVWTPTPPLLRRRTPRPGPARVCVCVLLLARTGGPASRARFGAPHLFLWRVWLRSSFFRPPPGRGCPVCGCHCVFFSSSLLRPPCLRRSVFSGPGCLRPWRLVFLLPAPPCFAFWGLFFLCLRCLSCCVASGPGCLGPWHLVVLRPPPRFFFAFFSTFLSLLFRSFRPGVPWALASCGPPARPPSLFFFVPPPLCFVRFLFFLFPFSASAFFFPALVCRLCAARAVWCVLGCGVC